MIDFNHPLLGPAESEPIKTTPLGIKVQTNGFDVFKPNRKKKGKRWLVENGLERFVGEFVALADGVESMLEHLDFAFTNRVAAWVECGGLYKQAKDFDPRKLTVTIEAAPFHIPFFGPETTFSGTVLDDNQIHIVVAHVHSSGAFFQDYRSLAAWEFGNSLQLALIGRPKDLSEEIGNKSPCGK